jgi:prepilin-type N-terminal cleavage/methylation domain-containing protein
MNGFRRLRCRTVAKHRVAMTLTELMCVLAILSILAALYLPAVARAFTRIKHFLGGM